MRDVSYVPFVLCACSHCEKLHTATYMYTKKENAEGNHIYIFVFVFVCVAWLWCMLLFGRAK